MSSQAPIILIAGPTASGKSSLAIEIAQAINAEIVNTDALQVYAAYEILTARPPQEDLKFVPHHLYGHITDENYSVGKWLGEVESLIKNASTPLIFVGGTGLYFDALVNGINDIPAVSADIRAQVQSDFNAHGLEYMLDELARVDPGILQKIDTQNPMRVMRAIEVWRATKTPLSRWQDQPSQSLIAGRDVFKLVLCPDKNTTNARIEKRFQTMMQSGALEEVQAQMNPWQDDAPANRALGAREIKAYLEGEIDEEEAIERAVIATRQYAKRQRNWFRSRMKSWHWASNRTEAMAIFREFMP